MIQEVVSAPDGNTMDSTNEASSIEYRSNTSSTDDLPPLAVGVEDGMQNATVTTTNGINTSTTTTETTEINHATQEGNGVAGTLTKMGQSLLSSSGLLGGINDGGGDTGGYGGFLSEDTSVSNDVSSGKNDVLADTKGNVTSAGGSGGGLFDVVDEEERRREEEAAAAAAAERERKELEQSERIRLAQELQTENERRLELEQQEREKDQQQQEQQQKLLEQKGRGLGTSMQELNLNDDVQNTPSSGQYVQGQEQAPPQNPFIQTQPTPQQQQPPQPSLQQPPQQQIQQAGFGGASYYYSTSGNVQQQVYQGGRSFQPSQQIPSTSSATNISDPTSAPIGSTPLNNTTQGAGYGGSVVANNALNGGSTMAIQGDESTISYSQRSQMRQASTPIANYGHPSNPTQVPGITPNAGMYTYSNEDPAVHSATSMNAVAGVPGQTMNNNPTNGHGTSLTPHGMQNTQYMQSMPQGTVNQQPHIVHHVTPNGQQPGMPNSMSPTRTPPAPASYPDMSSLPPPYDLETFTPHYGKITVTDPILVQSPGMFSGPPHWTYNINVPSAMKVEGQQDFAPTTSVRRRFRHFVALEERLRVDCPGTILPPRPEKHAIRAIDEATTRQSAHFAAQRAQELEDYLNALRLHPLTGKSQVLHIFLTLPDHIGVAWPEVSSSLFTRLTEAGASTAVKVAEGTSAVVGELTNENLVGGEENSEMLALASAEGLRIGSVVQAVPKIEGSIALVDEYAERMNINGLEVQRLVKCLDDGEREITASFEILCTGLLRSGRRTKRLAVELSAAAQPYIHQYKLCRYERMAFADRRAALVKRREAKKDVEQRAQKYALVQQQHLQAYGNLSMMGRMDNDTAALDELAMDAMREADFVGKVVQMECKRIGDIRRKEWMDSLKIMVANMRETCSERVAIWEDCRQSFMTEMVSSHGNPVEGVGGEDNVK